MGMALIIGIVILFVGPLVLSSPLISKLGCIGLSIYSAIYTYNTYSAMLNSDDGSLGPFIKSTLFIILSFIFLLGPVAVDLNNDGIAEWIEDGQYFAAVGDDWLKCYLKFLVYSVIFGGLLCFFAIDMGFGPYLFIVPVIFGGIALILLLRNLFR